MNRRTNNRKNESAPNAAARERLSALLLIAIVFSVVAHAFLINTTILNVVEGRDITHEISSTKQRIAELEVALIEQESALTIERAKEEGFERINTRNFVKRDTNLSLRNE